MPMVTTPSSSQGTFAGFASPAHTTLPQQLAYTTNIDGHGTHIRIDHLQGESDRSPCLLHIGNMLSTELLLGKENGEAELETMARIIWLERQKYLTLTISERLQQFYKVALKAVENP
jgi:hypothetical protein